MTRDTKTEIEKQSRWHRIMRREQAKAEAAERDGEQYVERNGVVALAGEVEGQDDEWVVMDDCPDDLQDGE